MLTCSGVSRHAVLVTLVTPVTPWPGKLDHHHCPSPMKHRRWIVAPLLSLACGGPHQSSTSAVRVINGEPSCADCQVVLKEVAVLGDSLDSSSPRPDAAGRECMVGRLGSGEYVLSGIVGGGQINVYSATGAFVRSIGRRGQGSGEFGERVRLIVGRGDTLLVMDDSNLRIQVLAPNGAYVRTYPSQGRVRNFALLNSGALLLHKVVTSPEDFVFHVVNASGAEVARFGRPTQAELDLELWIASPGQSCRPSGISRNVFQRSCTGAPRVERCHRGDAAA